VWFWQKIRQINQCTRTKRTEIDQHKYYQLIFDKGAKTIKQRKDSRFNNDAGTAGHLHGKK
jgi:hypothetical protein